MHEDMAPGGGPTARTERRHGPRTRRVAIAIGSLVLLVTVPACSSSSTPMPASTTTSVPTASTTSTTSSVVFPQGSAAEIADCESDARALETALAAYQAETGAYPSPSPWSAATYATNFLPLTSAGHGGPFLPKPPATTFYVIEFDSAGHIYVAPPGAYGTYNPGQDFDAHPDICDAAVG